MPASAFAGAKELIKKAIGSDWAKLTRRILNYSAQCNSISHQEK